MISNKFKIGDKVRLLNHVWVDCQDYAIVGNIYTIVPVDITSEEFFKGGTVELETVEHYPEDFEIVEVFTEAYYDIARPVLEERKTGKIRMELFDSGFPNAVLEIAKVMTWANLNKGYSDHDWKNLPEADISFSAAASRHKIKGLIQKDQGIAAIDRTDEESNIVHLAHTAFNVLAELELVLTGRIK